MDYTPITPFRRPMDAVILQHQTAASADLPPTGTNKWEILRELSTARTAFGLSDRDLAVLQALVSFHPATILGGNDGDLIVHPSNRSICERLNGMASSTMRRHLGHLVQSGFILRRDSANGKRYARRYGAEKIAFGFDLSPLVRRAQDICEAAEEVRAATERLMRLRTTVSLMRRDLAGLVGFGRTERPTLPVWDRLVDLAELTARELRRKLELSELEALAAQLGQALDEARGYLEWAEAEELSTNAVRSEQHHQNSNKEPYDFEPRLEEAKAAGGGELTSGEPGAADVVTQENMCVSHDFGDAKLPNIPLGLVLRTCQEFRNYCDGPVRHWHDLVSAADVIRPMMGVSPSAWDEAKRQMGPEEAAVVVVAMLERIAEIRSPGGYLRALSGKAALGNFSCGPMIMALVRRDAA